MAVWQGAQLQRFRASLELHGCFLDLGWIQTCRLRISLLTAKPSHPRILTWNCVTITAPLLAGATLKCFTWLLETGVTGSILLPKLKRDNLITKVVPASQFDLFSLQRIEFSSETFVVDFHKFCKLNLGPPRNMPKYQFMPRIEYFKKLKLWVLNPLEVTKWMRQWEIEHFFNLDPNISLNGGVGADLHGVTLQGAAYVQSSVSTWNRYCWCSLATCCYSYVYIVTGLWVWPNGQEGIWSLNVISPLFYPSICS